MNEYFSAGGPQGFSKAQAAHHAYLQTKEGIYAADLQAGKIERSNLVVNKEFLASTDILKRDHKILEVGCGAGSMTAYLTRQGFNVVGTDVSQVLLDYAQQRHPQCTFSRMMGENLHFDDGSFHIVLSFDVLEHIPDVAGHLREVHRVLRPQGYYLLQTPNKWTNLPFAIVRDKSLSQWRNYHPSLQTKKSLTRLLNACGFSARIVRMKVSNQFVKQKLFFPFNYINVDALPIQTNLYVIAQRQ